MYSKQKQLFTKKAPEITCHARYREAVQVHLQHIIYEFLKVHALDLDDDSKKDTLCLINNTDIVNRIL